MGSGAGAPLRALRIECAAPPSLACGFLPPVGWALGSALRAIQRPSNGVEPSVPRCGLPEWKGNRLDERSEGACPSARAKKNIPMGCRLVRVCHAGGLSDVGMSLWI